MSTSYDADIVAWADEQAALLRAGKLDAIDALHIAEEIEDVGKGAQRELANRLSVLLAHLLKWKYQPAFRSASWENTIREQRRAVRRRLRRAPSLSHVIADEDWVDDVWDDAARLARTETGIVMPDQMIWPLNEVLDEEFWPD